LEPIKIHFELTPDLREEFKAFIKETIAAEMRAHVATVRSEQKSLTRKEAAIKLSIGLNSVDKLIASGELRSRRVGKRILIPETELESFLKQSA
jgi:excisionase family DNA binding protein